MGDADSSQGRKTLTAAALDPHDRARLRELKRTKWLAGGVLVASLTVLVIAKLLERHNAGFGFLAAFTEAATIGGLADWYAVVVLFRRPLGLPIPHTAIIPANHREIAERLGGFIETHFLAPEPVGAKLRRVDFAVAASEWLRDPERSDGLARLILRLLPQALTAAEHSGLRGFLARQLVDQIEAVKLAPLTAELMTTFTQDQRHQRLLDEVLLALNRLMTDPVTLNAIRQKIRAELPTLLNLYRAESTGSLRHSSIKLRARPSTPQGSRRLSAISLPTHASATSRRACGRAFAAFSNRTFGARIRCFTRICGGF